MSTQSITPIVQAPRLPNNSALLSLEESLGSPRKTLRFAPHEHLFFQGDAVKGVFQILSGTVIVYKLTADGRRQVQEIASDGDCLALAFSHEHDLSAEALTDVEAHFTPRAAFERALQDDPSFRRRVFTLISEMLHASRDQAMLLGRKNAMERTATFLLFLDSRFANQDSGFTPVRMARSDIADYLGLTLETVSRMMNRLKRSGIIDLPQPYQFRILNRARLIALAGEVETDTHGAFAAIA